jgi:gas vesicle structural protein
MSRKLTEAGLTDVLDRVLDKGVVIDAYVRVALVGVELVSVDARVVVASIETYLRHAETLAYTELAARPLPDADPAIAAPPGAALPGAVPPLLAEPAAAEEPAAPEEPPAPEMT